jgi:putative peptidoglycan lipid II flippase
VLDWQDPALRRVLMLMGPGTLGIAATQINLFVNTQLATAGDGWVSWLQYAFRVMYLPIGIFGVSVATAAAPDLARHAARGLTAEMRTTISSALRLSLMLGVPSSIGLIVLAQPIVELMFQRGAFLPSDTVAVAAALAFYAPGLIGYSAVKLFSPSFYALGDARTPVLVSLVSVATNLGLNLMLVRVMEFRGLALGTSIAAIVNAGLLLWLLSRRLDGLDGRRVVVSFGKILVAAAFMGLVAFVAEQQVRSWLPVAEQLDGWVGPLLVRLARVGAGIGAGIVALAAASHVLRIAEFQQASRRLRARFSGA